MKSKEGIDKVLSAGFDFVQIARALINDPGFINKIRSGEISVSACKNSNYCIARMYSGKMSCFQHEKDLPGQWRKELE
jgi:2,4-dienoyl-CoA reductase-like NADH-dependent reductase (Old Yellow Enzyme family)